MVRRLIILLCLLAGAGTPALGAKSRYTLSAQYESLAPNAGGQIAYGLRLAKSNWEAGIFSNQYLTAGGVPVTGVVFDRRFPICDESCWWQFFVQIGAGGSNAGPIAEVTWATIMPLLPIWLPTSAPRFVPALRLDITSHMIFVRYRGIAWSYPLWLGVSVPF
jgi:hypothetical protein